MRKFYTKNNEVYKHIYRSSIYWLMDLDTNSISYNYYCDYYSEDSLDFIANHFNYWTQKTDYKKVEIEIFSLLGDQQKEHDGLFNPEKVIYQFEGILTYGESVVSESMQINNDTVTFELDNGFDPITVSLKEFDKLGLGTIEKVDDDDGNETIEFYPESGDLDYYMRSYDIERMNEYLNNLINGINAVYNKYSMPLIEK